MSDIWAIPTFFAVKFTAYYLWCRLGIRWIQGPDSPRWTTVLGYTTIRIIFGFSLGAAVQFAFGIFWGPAGNRLGIPAVFGSWILTYIVVGVSLRLLLWSGLAYKMRQPAVAPKPTRDWLWIGGGILLSFLTDWIGGGAAMAIVGGIC